MRLSLSACCFCSRSTSEVTTRGWSAAGPGGGGAPAPEGVDSRSTPEGGAGAAEEVDVPPAGAYRGERERNRLMYVFPIKCHSRTLNRIGE